MTFSINPIPIQKPNTAFTVSGSYTATAAPLQYSDGSTFQSVGVDQTTVNWSFRHPGMPAGSFRLTVKYPGTPLSAGVVVQVGVPTIVPGTPGNVTVG